MSAFLLDDKNYNYLLSVIRDRTSRKGLVYSQLMQFDLKNDEHLAHMGNILKSQNVRSLNARYPKSPTELVSFEFKYKHQNETNYVMTALKILSCYEYQSCESDDWYDSVAYKLVNVLRARLVSTLPGYEDAPWGL